MHTPIENNEWCALTNRVWDIVYRTVARNLTIRTRPRDILLRLRISRGVVHFSGTLYYNDFKLTVSQSQITVGNNVCFMTNCQFTNVTTAIEVDTTKGSIGIGSSTHEHVYKAPISVFLRHGKSALYKTFLIPRGCKFCHKLQLP